MKYYFVAGERSGDIHASNLIRALKKYDFGAEIRGFGGEEMQQVGMSLKVHYRDMALMGFLSLATKVFSIFKFIAICKKDIDSFRPDVIILVDYGGFNLRIAKYGKKAGIKVFYYITPKVWAWYQSRAYQLKANVDRMFVILPFEKQFFKKFDWEVDYVGNPVLDAIKIFKQNPAFRSVNRISGDKPVVALLPGSRKIELKRIVPLMATIAKRNANIQFVVAVVSSLEGDLYSELRNIENVKFVEDASYDLLSVAKAAIVTSGTATLETSIFRVPQVVVYKTGRFEYALAKNLVQVAFISLINLIANKEVIREMIQQQANADDVNTELLRLLSDQVYRDKMIEEYERIYKILDTGSASENAARLMNHYLTTKS